MADITYIGVSANVAAGSGNITITPPTTQTDDIMVCAVSTHDNIVLSFPSGWTKFQEGNNTTALRTTLAWKRCVGAEAAFLVTHTAGDGIVGNVIVFRYCLKSGSPIHASSLKHNASSSTCTADAISTTIANCMILFTMHDSDNGASSAQTCTNPGTLTERFDNASTLGVDQAVSGAQALKSATGSTGNATGTLSLGPDINSGGLVALAPDLTQTIVAAGNIDTGFAAGALTIILSVVLTGILSGEVFGTPTITQTGGGQTIIAQGIASLEVIGLPTVTATYIILPNGIDSTQALGTPSIVPGAVGISPSGILSGEEFGTPAVLPGSVSVLPTAIISEEAPGDPLVSPGAVNIFPEGIIPGEAFGSPEVSLAGVVISPTGMSSEESFGSPSIIPGTVTIQTASISSAETFGLATIIPANTISAIGITSTEVIGSCIISSTYLIVLSGITSVEVVGTPTILQAGPQTIEPLGIISGEGVGLPILGAQAQSIQLAGIISSEAFGSPTVKRLVIISTYNSDFSMIYLLKSSLVRIERPSKFTAIPYLESKFGGDCIMADELYAGVAGLLLRINMQQDVSSATNRVLRIKGPNATSTSDLTPVTIDGNYFEYTTGVNDFTVGGTWQIQPRFTFGGYVIVGTIIQVRVRDSL